MKASFTPAATQQSPAARRARGKIVTYKEARDEGATELWSEMERLIDQIDRAPDNYDVVDGFCRGTLARFEDWTKDLEKFFATLPQSGSIAREHMHKIEKMGLARVDITRDITLHLGAVPEVLRRYNEEYIPQAQQRENETRDPEDALALNSTCCRKDDFVSRHTLLEATRLISLSTAQFLRQVMEAKDMEWGHSHFAQVIQPGLDNWRQQRAGGGIFSRVLETASQAEGSGGIKIRKPLRFKQPVSA
ncbi:MAG: hypothetical protein ACAH80_17765 [Alphaproteobacteria bacterium]